MGTTELLLLVAARLEVNEILDILGWDASDLVEALADDIVNFKEEFEAAVE